MDRPLSPISLNEDEQCVKIVALNEHPEEMMENLPEQMNTQYVLDVQETPKKKPAKGKQLISQRKKQIATMKKHAMWQWLENSWQSDVTIPAMKPWLTLVNQKSLETKNMKMYHVGQKISKIMKEFILYLREQKMTLTNCGFANFEEWACGEGFSTTFGKLQAMDWDDGLNELLFTHYSDAIMELAKRQAEQEEMDETEYLSLQNMKNTSTSSTTARMPDPLADASTSKDCENIQQTSLKRKKTADSTKKVSFQKAKLPLKKQRKLSFDDEKEEENYQPGTLFVESQNSVEDESEPDVDIRPKMPKKSTKKTLTYTQVTDSEPEETMDEVVTEEDYATMLGNLAQAHSLVQSTGKISQSISLKDGDAYINITSPGERGYMLMKLELYPFKDCVKLQKNQYWTKRSFSSLAVISGQDCPAYKLLMALRTQITKDIMKIKGVKTEKKSQTGWKSG